VANIKSAAKRARQSEKRRQHNVALRSNMRTALKKAQKAVASGDAASATAAVREGGSRVDSMAGKGIIHPNKAARHKSRMNKALKALGAGGASKAAATKSRAKASPAKAKPTAKATTTKSAGAKTKAKKA
jgi:small subunit ribosomal protein S20